MSSTLVPFDFDNYVWSHSSLKMYEECPHQFYHIRVAKDVKADYGPAAMDGNKKHKILEDYFKDGVPVPDHMPTYKGYAEQLAAMPGEKQAELRMCISAAFEPVSWEGIWNLGPGAWGVSIADLAVYDPVNKPDAVGVIDWKTGKHRGDDGQAARLAAATFVHYPQVERVTAIFIYTEYGKVAPYVFHRQDLATIMAPTYRILGNMQWSAQNNAWPKRESPLCGFCSVLSCEHNTSLSRRRSR